MANKRIGFAVTGSFCTFEKALAGLEELARLGYDLYPIMSETSYANETRFGKAEDFRRRMEEITVRQVIHTIAQAEPIGPKALLDLVVVAPCTGNTLAKLAWGITDTPVAMAVKAHLRNGRPVLLGVSTNDALAGSAKNIGMLLNAKNIYFIPMGQDDPEKKPASVVAHFDRLPQAVEAALAGKQLQPMLG